MRNYFKTDNGKNKGNNKKQPPEIRRLFKKKNAGQGCTYSANTGPYGIGGTNRNGLNGFVKP